MTARKVLDPRMTIQQLVTSSDNKNQILRSEDGRVYMRTFVKGKWTSWKETVTEVSKLHGRRIDLVVLDELYTTDGIPTEKIIGNGVHTIMKPTKHVKTQTRPSHEEYLILKEKSLKGQILKAERVLGRVIHRRLLNEQDLKKYHQEVANTKSRLEGFHQELIEQKSSSQDLVRKRQGYESWGEFQ